MCLEQSSLKPSFVYLRGKFQSTGSLLDTPRSGNSGMQEEYKSQVPHTLLEDDPDNVKLFCELIFRKFKNEPRLFIKTT